MVALALAVGCQFTHCRDPSVQLFALARMIAGPLAGDRFGWCSVAGHVRTVGVQFGEAVVPGLRTAKRGSTAMRAKANGLTNGEKRQRAAFSRTWRPESRP
jgi:hypothetical protein